MTTRVKICGVSTTSILDAALDAGADDIGLNFYPPSPRYVNVASAMKLANLARGKVRIVAVTVDATDTELDAIVADVAPDLLQLHGHETPERCVAIRRRFGITVMKAIGIAAKADLAKAAAYASSADHILYDAQAPKGATLPGGNGRAFDWKILHGVAARQPYMLSGGLTPANVAAAIKATGARAVDVSSGVEMRTGIKDAALVANFIAAAKAMKV
jgi:phosphoribosylanthranilate isomerase